MEPVVFIGGGSRKGNKLQVNERNHAMVGTPGKIYQIISRSFFKPKVDLSRVKFFVADEADELMHYDN